MAKSTKTPAKMPAPAASNVTPLKAVPRNDMARMAAAFEHLVGSKHRDKFLPDKARTINIPPPWPGVMPRGVKSQLAMDQGVMNAITNMTSFAVSYGGWEQAEFLGYAVLAEFSQIPEFRRPAEILANEMTRKWGKLVSSSDDKKTRAMVRELTDDMVRFKVRESLNKIFELDNFFGIGHIYIDVGTEGEELQKPLLVDKVKIGKNSLKGFKVIEPMWTYPSMFNAIDPLKPDFYQPSSWYVMGTLIDKSRLIQCISRPVPDMLKPAYLFGGVSLTQLLRPYVNNWLRTRQSVSDITHNFSTMVLATDMDQMTTKDAASALAMRAQVFNEMRDNQGLFVCDKEKEEFDVKAAPLSNLSDLQAQAIEQMAFPAGIPLIKLLGVTPSGLNASSDGEVRTYYDSIASVQERVGTPALKRMLDILQLNRYGAIDPGIMWAWNALWSIDEEKSANIRKINAETDVIYTEGMIIDPKTILEKITRDPESDYAGLEVKGLPTPIPPKETRSGTGGRPDTTMKLTSLVGKMGPPSVIATAQRSREARAKNKTKGNKVKNKRPKPNTKGLTGGR